ncbi:division/cell wall cluster transcriptional repressor MraZ [Sutterella megalosphaeroides]|uniref:Transcriptional regulator MraZ n=1 Tax=Sutterella megalosphaeroides TaxID=2494234 RepID=A0A2Z6ICY0_9BURK|nr:division/cell wall cluster transcriptional repressor MraZ [Sutterella megalosphaeroides]BBF22496.1 transcriptional regulator MraZ [Sutterella megalosphaeroides]
MYQGTSLLVLDAKGRLSVPARHREALCAESGGGVVVTRHPDGCLVIYPTPVWEEKCEALRRLPYSARALVRFVLGSAVEVNWDAAGRLLIPAELRTLAGLSREAALVGVGTHFELWDRAALLEREAQDLAAGLDAADFVF